MDSKKFFKKKGFTLTELLVVIFVISTMAVLSVASLSYTRTSSRLSASQREVASAIRTAQSYALQGKKQGGNTPCGYGFRFDPTDAARKNYQIYYNLPGTGAANDCAHRNADANYLHYRSDSGKESFSLGGGAALSGGASFAGTEVYFTVPHGKMFDSAGAEFGSATIGISFDGKTKSVSVQKTGLVTEN